MMTNIRGNYEPTTITLYRFIDALMGALIFFAIGTYYNVWYYYNYIAFFLIFFIVIVTFTYFGVYRTWQQYGLYKIALKSVLGSAIVIAILLAISYPLNALNLFPPEVILLWIILWPSYIFVERNIVRMIFKKIHKKGFLSKNAIIVGVGQSTNRLIKWFDENPWSETNILGIFCDEYSPDIVHNSLIIGSLDQITKFVKENNINVVYLTFRIFDEEKIQTIIKELTNLPCALYMVPDIFMHDFVQNVHIMYLDNLPIFSLVDTPLRGLDIILKRLEDIVLGSIILILTSPIMIVTAIILRLSSKDSVLFKQWRYGLDGHPIQIWKFRTMNSDENGYNFNQVTKNDRRVTKIGKFLRRTSLDEFPQFINVLQGRMSIVGPRPHTISMVDEYSKQVSGSMLRHLIKPGITGLAQLSGTRGEINGIGEIEKRVYYDIKYMKMWSVFLDIKLIFLTILSLVNRKKEVY